MTDHLTDTNVGNIEYIRREDMLNAVETLDIIPSVDGMGIPTDAEDFRVQFLGTVLKVEPADVVQVVRKPVTGYEGYYEVDQFGRVFSLDRIVIVEDNGRIYDKSIKGRQMKQITHSKGYKTVALTKDGKTTMQYVHRIVAEAFIPNPDNLPMVNHKDEDKTNNFVDNLEWCTCGYNINYGTAIERSSQKKRGIKHTEGHKKKIADSVKDYYTTHDSPTKGKPSPNRKAVISIDENGDESFYDSVDDAVKAIGVHDSRNILAVCRGDRKTAYGRRWRYADAFCSYGERKE